MKSILSTKKKFKLILNEKEAKWLKDMCQNPLVENESKAEAKIRISFFKAVKDAGHNYIP